MALRPLLFAAVLVFLYVSTHEAGHAVACAAVGFDVQSVSALGVRLYPLPLRTSDAPTTSFAGLTRCSVKRRLMELDHPGAGVEAARRRLVIEQGVVLMSGYWATSALQLGGCVVGQAVQADPGLKAHPVSKFDCETDTTVLST